MMSLPVGSGGPAGPSLVRRLAASYALLVMLIVVAGLTGAAAMTVSLATSDRVLQEVAPAREVNAAVRLDLAEIQGGVRGYLLAGDVRFLEQVRQGRKAWDRDTSRLQALAGTSGVGVAVEHELRLAESWLATYLDPVVVSSGEPGGLERTRQTRDNEAARLDYERYRDAALEVDHRLRAESVRLQQRSDRVRGLALAVLVVVVTVSVLLGSAAAVRTAGAAVGPLSRLRRTVESMTAGHGDRRADETAGPTEVRAVAAAINALSDERARLQARGQDQVHARRLAHDVGLRIRERIDVAEVEQVAVEEVGSAFGVDRVLLRVLADGVLGPVAREWSEVDAEPLTDAALGRLVAAGTAEQAVRLWDDIAALHATAGPDGSEPADVDLAEVLRVCRAGSVLVVAFGAGRDTLGTLTLVQRHRRVWTDAEVVAVESIAADLGRALQHATLYARERSLVQQLRALDRTKTDFLSTVSHELRTPLTSITGYIEMLRDDVHDLEPDQVRMLDVIERNSYRLSSLIEDLLTLSRIESGAVHSQRVPVDLAALIHNACADVAAAAAEAGLVLVVDGGPDGARTLGDPGQLDRVLLNLLSNAVKFTPSGGDIRVAWTVDGAAVHVLVTDTGIGIPAEEKDQLLSSRFYRASNAMSSAIPGTGLGLSIVRGILEIHGGALAVQSSPRGTRMDVRLPLMAGSEPEPAGELAVRSARL